MTRLPQLPARKIIQALEKVGFVLRRQRGSHCVMKHAETGIKTVVPIHGGDDVDRGLLKKIIKQAGLTETEFEELL